MIIKQLNRIDFDKVAVGIPDYVRRGAVGKLHFAQLRPLFV